jgi:tyrosine-protein phosphatase YwqE
MFNFFKKSKDEAPAFLPITLDIHSHILPGIDDGSPDIATSLQLLQGLYDLGIRKSVATPHIIGDMYRNTPQTINDALKKVQDACVKAQIDIELSAAAEYMLDDHFMELLKKEEPLLTLHKNILLTEISYSTTPDNLGEIAANIIEQGYLPVMAHPERYHYYQQNFEKYHQLMEMGFVLQINLLSLTGYYGKKAEKAVKFILDNNLALLAGTDLHHDKHLAAFSNEKNRLIFQQYLEGKFFNELDAIALKL